MEEVSRPLSGFFSLSSVNKFIYLAGIAIRSERIVFKSCTVYAVPISTLERPAFENTLKMILSLIFCTFLKELIIC